MSTQTVNEPATTDSSDDDTLVHVTWCCNDNRSLCGVDLSDAPWKYDAEPPEECIVCNEMDEQDCVGCGR